MGAGRCWIVFTVTDKSSEPPETAPEKHGNRGVDSLAHGAGIFADRF